MSKKTPPAKAIPPRSTAAINEVHRKFREQEDELQSKILKSKHGAEILAAAARSMYMERAAGMPIYNQTDFGVALANEALKRSGEVFTNGRKAGTSGPIRKAIAKFLKADPTLKNPAMWRAVSSNPPRGWTAYDNAAGKYLEGPIAGQNMDYKGRFCTVCGEERKKITG